MAYTLFFVWLKSQSGPLRRGSPYAPILLTLAALSFSHHLTGPCGHFYLVVCLGALGFGEGLGFFSFLFYFAIFGDRL